MAVVFFGSYRNKFEFRHFILILALGWVFCSVCKTTHGTDKKHLSPALIRKTTWKHMTKGILYDIKNGLGRH